MAGNPDLILGDRQRLACGYAQLFFNNVKARDHFGDRMFHLHAGVHFYEIEFAFFVQKFKRARAQVANINTGFGATFADEFALLLGDAGCGRFFHHFLMAALHGAIALAQMDGVAV